MYICIYVFVKVRYFVPYISYQINAHTKFKISLKDRKSKFKFSILISLFFLLI